MTAQEEPNADAMCDGLPPRLAALPFFEAVKQQLQKFFRDSQVSAGVSIDQTSFYVDCFKNWSYLECLAFESAIEDLIERSVFAIKEGRLVITEVGERWIKEPA